MKWSSKSQQQSEAIRCDRKVMQQGERVRWNSKMWQKVTTTKQSYKAKKQLRATGNAKQ
jgi:hypothetical protein